MKKILFSVIAVISALFSFAGEEQPIVVSAGHASRIELGDDMKVILVRAGSLPVEKNTTSTAAFQKLFISVDGGSVTVSLRKRLKANEVIYLVVENIENLTIGDNTVAETENYITGKELKIRLGDQAYAFIRTTASIKAFLFDGSPVELNEDWISYIRATRRFNSPVTLLPSAKSIK